MDGRPAVAREFAATIFDKLFIRPRDWDDAHAAAHVEAATEAIKGAIPRERLAGAGLTKAAGVALKRNARTNAWPTVREILHAIGEAKATIELASDEPDWPHRNSDAMIAGTESWIKAHGRWPEWADKSRAHIARALVDRGAFTEYELRAAGFRE